MYSTSTIGDTFIIPAGGGLTWADLSIRPTPTLGLFLLPDLVLLLAAAQGDRDPLFALGLLLAALVPVSLGWGLAGMLGLRVRPGRTEQGMAGEGVRFELRLQARRPLPALALVTPRGSLRLPALAPGIPTTFWLPWPAPQRGPVRPGPLVFVHPCPLGLFRLRGRCRLPLLAWAWPRPAARADAAGTAGIAPDDPAPGEEDFRGLRPYRPGDSRGRICWRTLARGQGLLSRDFAPAAERPDWIDWYRLEDTDGERRLSRLCRALLDAGRGDRPYGLRLPGTEITPGRGPLHLERCLIALARHGFSEVDPRGDRP